MAAVGHAREGGWLGVGRSWRSRMLGASLCLPAGNRLSGTPKAYRCPAGRWLRAGEQLGDTELRMGPVLCPAREGGRESAAVESRPFHLRAGKAPREPQGQTLPQTLSEPSRTGTLLGAPSPSRGGPRRGLAWCQSPPAAPSPPNIEIYIFCFVYTACTEYTASDNYFPVDWKCLPR